MKTCTYRLGIEMTGGKEVSFVWLCLVGMGGGSRVGVEIGVRSMMGYLGR